MQEELCICYMSHVSQFFCCRGTESLGARLVDGPGKCAGRVEIMHEGQWKKVDKKQWTKTNSDTVCKQLKCGNARKSASSENFSPGLSDFLQKTVTCTSSASNISMCSIGDLNNSIDKKEALGITCEGESAFLCLSVLSFDLLLLYLTVILQFHTVNYIWACPLSITCVNLEWPK